MTMILINLREIEYGKHCRWAVAIVCVVNCQAL